MKLQINKSVKYGILMFTGTVTTTTGTVLFLTTAYSEQGIRTAVLNKFKGSVLKNRNSDFV
jgi:hypothetical protein